MASRQTRQMHLNVFLMGAGHHEAAWRLPGSRPLEVTRASYYLELLRTAERGKLDSLFLADSYALPPTIQYKVLQSLEPFTLLSALAMGTSRIGLIGTASTTYSHPYHVARQFASLDHISEGRAAWNIVTSTNDATGYNFTGERLPEHGERYRRAEEFVEVVRRLWDSWEDEAVLADRERGIYADPARIHPIHHRGESFAVRGPLNLPRPPQGQPVRVQAGASEAGKAFAARLAEVVFTAQSSLADAQAFYTDVKSRLAQAGRTQDELKILPGFCPIIGDTEAEAKEREQELHRHIQLDYGVQRLSNLFQADMSVYPLDEPVPVDWLAERAEVNGHRGRYALYVDLARRERLTMRELILRTASSRGHFAMAGTPAQIADEMERWWRQGGADGFNVMPPYLPDGLSDFVDKVVPELQSRGLFRSDYTGTTLREHYGLARPLAGRAGASGVEGRGVAGAAGDAGVADDAQGAAVTVRSIGRGEGEPAR
ncbi:LLM class flavin-dependent oxidoreductase [Paenibacillus sp. IB182496]|uniref:LLM class flavin-dependent oxidoreductase n=1 Tax=Paenibacillus sabuli TaxID=2772509 RepID=A0A927BZ88_9BACL|nr:LLM class flavin-dependent oxidoreductase [Paenibacillus sabuli]MBD2848465.1 LLM class flavin-dependent oxidoreductase [Paenibacillus sabuli]